MIYKKIQTNLDNLPLLFFCQMLLNVIFKKSCKPTKITNYMYFTLFIELNH